MMCFWGSVVQHVYPKICQVLLNVFIGAPETKSFMLKMGYNRSLQFLYHVCCDLNSEKQVFGSLFLFTVIYIMILKVQYVRILVEKHSNLH